MSSPPEDVALADAATMKRQQMSGGNVIDVHDVESRVHIGRHAAGRGIEHHLTRRRGLDVARARPASRD